MRDILEELPNALMPDLELESEAPGVQRDLLDDDLVRPVAEDDLRLDAGRSKKSPLARHVELTIAPFDPALSTTVGLVLQVEGARLRSLGVEVGFVHRGIERRAVGLRVDDPVLFALVAGAEPGMVARLALARAIERLLTMTPSRSTTLWRLLALDLTTVHESARVLRDSTRAVPALTRRLGAVVGAAEDALAGLVVAGRFDAIGGLRSAIPAHERDTLQRRLADLDRAVAAIDDDDIARVTERVAGAGVVDLQRARRFGVDGPTLRAAGGTDDLPADLGDDVRHDELGHGTSGCAAARIGVHRDDLRGGLRRLHRRLTTLETATDDVTAVAVRLDDVNGCSEATVRGPGGSAAILVDVVGGRVQRLRLRPPGLPLLAAVPGAMRGVLLDDAADVFATFGLRASALDR